MKSDAEASGITQPPLFPPNSKNKKNLQRFFSSCLALEVGFFSFFFVCENW